MSAYTARDVQRKKAKKQFRDLLEQYDASDSLKKNILKGALKAEGKTHSEFLEMFKYDNGDKEISRAEYLVAVGAATQQEKKDAVLEFKLRTLGFTADKATLTAADFKRVKKDESLDYSDKEIEYFLRKIEKKGGSIDRELFLQFEQSLFEKKAADNTAWFNAQADEEGTVSAEEAVAQLKSDHQELQKQFGDVERLSLDQFLVLGGYASEEIQANIERQQVREAFKAMDRDDNGFITLEELTMTFKELNFEPSERSLAKLYKKYEPTEDGISYERFYRHELAHLDDDVE